MTTFKWNWQQKNWPNFTYDYASLEHLEHQWIQENGVVMGSFKHINENESTDLIIDILSEEALKTSQIEGEYLDRESIQESIKKNLGLRTNRKNLPLAEFGIAEMMVNLYRTFDQPLTHKGLYEWHRMLTHGRRDLTDIGQYRTHEDPMQIVSGRLDRQTVHYEAPPSSMMTKEMGQFVSWYNSVHGSNHDKMLPLAKAGIAHFYFLAIHPFEDGNGRIARGLSEKSISTATKRPALTSLSATIESNKKEYYGTLEAHNFKLDLTEWLLYFGQTIIEAQQKTLTIIDFSISKAKFFDRFEEQMNDRQNKVVQRMFKAGPSGFLGGLSADNYKHIANTSSSTATRDLQGLVDKKILKRTGELKGTRYFLNLHIPNH